MRKQQYTQKKEDQIKWKNTTHEAQMSPFKKYYAVIKVGDKSFVTDYEAKFRSEAVALFDEEARIAGGKVEVIGVYK